MTTLGWVSYTSHGMDRIVWGILFLCTAAVLFATLGKERQLTSESVVTDAIVLTRRPRDRRGYSINYRFFSSTGQEYVERSVGTNSRRDPGSTIPIVYCAHDPTINLPLLKFLFYSIKTRDH